MRKRIFGNFSRRRGTPSDKKTTILGVAIISLCGLISRFLSGSPFRMMHVLGVWGHIPPVWMFSLIWLIWYALLGFCFGFVLGMDPPGKSVHKYKGCFYFVIMMVFNVLWYPLFFKAGMIFLSILDLIFMLLFCVLSFLEYKRVHKTIGFLMFLHFVWLVCCLCINIRIFLNI